jgi:hypothetical protein
MNILHAMKRRKANWIGHILRRICPPKHVIEQKHRRKYINVGQTKKKAQVGTG